MFSWKNFKSKNENACIVDLLPVVKSEASSRRGGEEMRALKRILEEFGTLFLIVGLAIAMAFLIILTRILATYTNILITMIGMVVFVGLIGLILWLLDKRSKI